VRIAATESVSWLKKPITGATSYAAGFGPHDLRCLGGAKHTAPTAGTLLMGLPIGTVDNAELTLSSGALPASIEVQLRVDAGHKVVLPSSNPQAVSLTLDPATGTLKGKFTLGTGTTAQTADYFGIIVPEAVATGSPTRSVGLGYFILPGTTGALLSGRVDLQPSP
jgi:hypothetical protein